MLMLLSFWIEKAAAKMLKIYDSARGYLRKEFDLHSGLANRGAKPIHIPAGTEVKIFQVYSDKLLVECLDKTGKVCYASVKVKDIDFCDNWTA